MKTIETVRTVDDLAPGERAMPAPYHHYGIRNDREQLAANGTVNHIQRRGSAIYAHGDFETPYKIAEASEDGYPAPYILTGTVRDR